MKTPTRDFSTHTLAQHHRSLSVISYALAAGLGLFLIYFKFLFNQEIGKNNGLEGTLGITCSVAFAAALVFIFVLIPKQIQKIPAMGTMNEKLRGYHQWNIFRMAATEAPGLLSLISFVVTGQVLFIAGAVLSIVLLLALNPSKTKILEETGLAVSDFPEVSP